MSVNNARAKVLQRASMQDGYAVTHVYVDIAGDLVAGILLGQILYWNKPDKAGRRETKLRVWKNGELWLAKAHKDWWDEIRVTEKQSKRAMKILKDAGLIRTRVHKYDNTPILHIQVIWEELDRRETELLEKLRFNESEPISPKGTSQLAALGKDENDEKMAEEKLRLNDSEPFSTKGTNQLAPKVLVNKDERDSSITETTSKITAEIRKNYKFPASRRSPTSRFTKSIRTYPHSQPSSTALQKVPIHPKAVDGYYWLENKLLNHDGYLLSVQGAGEEQTIGHISALLTTRKFRATIADPLTKLLNDGVPSEEIVETIGLVKVPSPGSADPLPTEKL